MVHKPVLVEEVIDNLNLGNGKIVVDCTLGAGGHSLKILQCIAPGGRLIGIDQDKDILEIASENLKAYKDNINLLYGNFKDIDNLIRSIGIEKVDAVLYDLGVSSLQLDTPERGFSFKSEGPLDMRMDKAAAISAFDLVNNLPRYELRKVLSQYGQERQAGKIANLIVEKRKLAPIESTVTLSRIVTEAYPYKARFSKIHPATRTFQALRIAVNNELDIIQMSIAKAVDILNSQGRIGVIAFHSLEDRIIKNTFKHCASEQLLKIITKKPIRPSSKEVIENPRSRSARLRVAEKVKVLK
ncbi:MAG: 16S rRNA (cytosine(1402)-N(4))-methyltransferase RsmH [Candidatus Kappaea frigidicola]|nr:16S rRNA (cytosine(1402)-N(4))-methyltransferase RsmH [Candidatus Kappaea frigidicola]